MAIKDAIVSSRSLDGAFKGQTRGEETFLADDDRHAMIVDDPSFLAEVSSGLTEIRLAESRPGILSSPQNGVGSLIQSFAAEYAQARVQLDSGGEEVQFDSQDAIGWVASLWDWMKRLKKHSLVPSADVVETIPNDCRIALFADWGTGMYGAPAVSRSITQDRLRFNVVLHLGDVYYSGTPKEESVRCVDMWPSCPGALNRALNSNHEMYSGGEGYFDVLLPRLGQSSSYFALQNDYWLIVGLDSAYSDHDLAGEQAEWLFRILASSGDRRLILLSHHQPFSLLDHQGPKLIARLADLLKNRRIFAWYWGHEHRCVVYDRHALWGLHGRCIGHGGFPYFRDRVPGAQRERVIDECSWLRIPSQNLIPSGLLLDGPNPFIPGHEAQYGPHGYATLLFEGHRLFESIRSADGTVLHELELKA